MNQRSETAKINRREFLKNLPQHIKRSLRAMAIRSLESNSTIARLKDQRNHGSEEGQIPMIDIERCLALNGISCQLCYLVCPLRDQAIKMEDQKPWINSLLCDGCAKCVDVCQTINDPPALEMISVRDRQWT